MLNNKEGYDFEMIYTMLMVKREVCVETAGVAWLNSLTTLVL
jgi:hypothetical protein